MIPTLLEASSKMAAVDKKGRTPLMLCCWKGHEDIAQMLMQRMSAEDILMTDENGMSALAWAARSGFPNLVPVLLRSVKGRSQELLDMQDRTGKTSLIHATTTGRAVHALLQAGADRYLMDKKVLCFLIEPDKVLIEPDEA